MKSAINFSYLIFLSVVAALGGFLFGYDTAVISGTIAQVSQLFQLDALQQGWYVGCALIGSIVGVLFYKRQNKLFSFHKTFCSKFRLVNTKQNVHFIPFKYNLNEI